MANEYCVKCGAALNGAQFCPSCGAAAVQTQTAPPPPPTAPAAPVYAAPYSAEMPPPKGSRFSVVGTGSFMGCILLFSIPVVGFIFMIVWACGGCKNLNKRNLARAYLFWALIGIAVTVILAVVFSALGTSFIDTIQNWFASREYPIY